MKTEADIRTLKASLKVQYDETEEILKKTIDIGIRAVLNQNLLKLEHTIMTLEWMLIPPKHIENPKSFPLLSISQIWAYRCPYCNQISELDTEPVEDEVYSCSECSGSIQVENLV